MAKMIGSQIDGRELKCEINGNEFKLSETYCGISKNKLTLQIHYDDRILDIMEIGGKVPLTIAGCGPVVGEISEIKLCAPLDGPVTTEISFVTKEQLSAKEVLAKFKK